MPPIAAVVTCSMVCVLVCKNGWTDQRAVCG